MEEQAKESKNEARDAMRALGQLVNRCCRAGVEEEFAAAFHKEHRTLQQGIIRLFSAVMLDMAKVGERGENWYDERNRNAMNLCMSVKPTLEKAFLPFI
jgi:hypothetical protein